MLSAAEKQILLIIEIKEKNNEPSTRPDLEESGDQYFCSYKLNWEKGFAALLQKKYVTLEKNEYKIISEYDISAFKQRKPRYKYWYNDWYRLADKSSIHKDLCEHAYGIDLCQTGMMTKLQIEYLCSLINKNEKGLDLGCGIGLIAEYIGKKTHACICGIDTIVSGVKRARDRTVNNNSLTFSLDDMQNYIIKTKETYDFIMSMDSLYFLGENFGILIKNCIKKLNKGGRLFIFYSAWKPKDSELSSLKTKIGLFLLSCHIKFDYVDFSENDYTHWQKKKEFLENHKSDFINEGNSLLYRKRYLEAKHFALLSEQRIMNRYLYVITH